MRSVAGKHWTKKEKKILAEQVAAGKSVGVIAEILGKSEMSIRNMKKRMGLDGGGVEATESPSSVTLVMPEEIPSVETMLKKAVAAVDALETPNLPKSEVYRLRALVQSACELQRKIGEYMNYRRIEAKLIDLDEKYERLVREMRKTLQQQ